MRISAFVTSRRKKLRHLESSYEATPRSKDYGTTSQDRDDIPWPALTKLAPGSLKMTASTLMSEWEKSLGRNIDDEADPLHDFTTTKGKTG